MQSRQVQIDYTVCAYAELSEINKALVDKAKSATQLSYAPYSRFNVGASILLANGEIITASNQENAAYPSGLCAERVAMFYANARYPEVAPLTLAIAAFTKGDFLDDPISPCGACRQVLLETEERYGKSIEILLYGKSGVYIISSIKSLLPFSFGKESL